MYEWPTLSPYAAMGAQGLSKADAILIGMNSCMVHGIRRDRIWVSGINTEWKIFKTKCARFRDENHRCARYTGTALPAKSTGLAPVWLSW